MNLTDIGGNRVYDSRDERLKVLKQRATAKGEGGASSRHGNNNDDDADDALKQNQPESFSLDVSPEPCFGGYKRQLEEMINTVKYNDYLRRMNLRCNSGMLLFGPPGTGKTTLVKHFISFLRRNSACHEAVIVNGPELLSKYVGESENRLRKLFEKALSEQQHHPGKQKLHVFVFEEIDSLFCKRGGGDDGHGDASKKTTDSLVNQVLTIIGGMVERSNILVIGTTNRFDMLDPAVLRPGRLDKHILIDLPDEEDRLAIYQYYLRKVASGPAVAVSPDVDIKSLAQGAAGCTGADIEAHFRDAAIRSIQRDDTNILLTMTDFVKTVPVRNEIKTDQQSAVTEYIPSVTTKDDMTPIIHAFASETEHKEGEGKALLIFHHDEGCPAGGSLAEIIECSLKSLSQENRLVKMEAMDALGRTPDELRDILSVKWKECQQNHPIHTTLFIDLVEHVIQYTDLDLAFDNALLHTVLSLITCCKRFGMSVIVSTRMETVAARTLKLMDKFDKTVLYSKNIQ